MSHKEPTNHNPPSPPLKSQHVKDVNHHSTASTHGRPLSWSTVVSNGLKKKVVSMSHHVSQVENESRPVPHLIFEDPQLSVQIISRKAAAIVQQALTPGAVVFSFPSSCFNTRQAAYRAIQDQIGQLEGVKCISMYSTKPTKELIIEALFKNSEDAHTAIRLGVVYQASSSNTSGLASLTRVQLDFLNIPTGETLSDRLIQSCKYYGKVYQIKKYTTDGFFEGQVSLMIDNTGTYEDDEGNQVPVKPLSRMLYLQAWDNFVSATFRGAPPVCYYCRQAGHIRSKCPVLANKECYRCGGLGHTIRVCKEKLQEERREVEDKTDTQLLEEYTERQAHNQIKILKRKSTPKETNKPVPESLAKKTTKDLSVTLNNSQSNPLDVDEIVKGLEYDAYKPSKNSTTHSVREVHYTEGSAASRWASEEVASKMDLDSIDSALFNTQENFEMNSVFNDDEKNVASVGASSSGMTPTSPTPDPALRA